MDNYFLPKRKKMVKSFLFGRKDKKKTYQIGTISIT